MKLSKILFNIEKFVKLPLFKKNDSFGMLRFFVETTKENLNHLDFLDYTPDELVTLKQYFESREVDEIYNFLLEQNLGSEVITFINKIHDLIPGTSKCKISIVDSDVISLFLSFVGHNKRGDEFAWSIELLVNRTIENKLGSINNIYCMLKSVIITASESLADERKAYLTTSARKVKTKTIKTDFETESYIECFQKINDTHLLKISKLLS